MGSGRKIVVSAPCKVHLLGEHSVVYGKPAIITSINLRVTVTISPAVIASVAKQSIKESFRLKEIIEPIIRKEFRIKKIPPYELSISSKIPLGCGLGSSASVSASYITALLCYLKIKWDLELVYKLSFEAEKIFHGNPSGGDLAAVVFGGLIWFRRETATLKLIQPLNFDISPKLTKRFVLINTGTPRESTKDMVMMVKKLNTKKPKKVENFSNSQEKLVKELLPVIKEGDEKEFIRIIRQGEKNLESIGVASKFVQEIIRKIEKLGGAAKICGAGGKSGPTGVLFCYHKSKKVVENIAKSYNLSYFSAKLGVEGIRKELSH